MNLLEKIEAALDCATPPMSDLLRECEAYVRAGMDQPPVIYIAEDDVGDFMASRTPDGDEPWEALYRHPMPPADECDELLLIAHMDGYYKGKQDGQKVPDGMQLVPDSFVEFVSRIQKQIPEKPDHWNSCGQCENSSNEADDLMDELMAARGGS